MEKKVKHTRKTLQKYHYLQELQKGLGQIMSQAFWRHRVPLKEKADYLLYLGQAKADFWSLVYEEFPQIRGSEAWANDSSISFKEGDATPESNGDTGAPSPTK